MVHRAWMDRPEYQHVESNPDPNFRPGLGKLVHKIRHLKLLKDRPDSVEFLLNDLEYWFFFREQVRPTALWRMMMRSKARWEMAVLQGEPGKDTLDRHRDAYMARADKEAWSERVTHSEDVKAAITEMLELAQNSQTGDVDPTSESLVGRDGFQTPTITLKGIDGYFVWHGTEPQHHPPMTSQIEQGLKSLGVLGLDGGAPPVFPLDLDDEELKTKVWATISRHSLIEDVEGDGLVCGCRREFRSTKKWAMHLRKRIWKTMKAHVPSDMEPQGD